MKKNHTLADIRQGNDPHEAGQLPIKLKDTGPPKPVMFSLLFTDKMEMNNGVPHHNYYAHGKLEETLGHDILRTAYSLPEGTFGVIVVNQYGKAIEAMVTSWIHHDPDGVYPPRHLAVAYYPHDKNGRNYAAKCHKSSSV